MNNRPLVSILMTAFNRQQFIAEAIESVMACTYPNWELIIVDDCSKDNTVAIAKNYEEKDSRINVHINEKNLGDYPNRNKAAGYAKGKYLVWVDSDDTMMKNVLELWIEEMERYQIKFGIFSKSCVGRSQVFSSEQIIKNHFNVRPALNFGPGATITARDFFWELRGFPTKYGAANDMYQHLKIASQTPVLIFSDYLINYRIHDNQELNDKYSYIFHNYNYLKDALKELPLPLNKNQINFLSKKNKRRFVVNIVRYWAKTKDHKKSFAAIQKARFTFFDFLSGVFHI
ncbi:glycosyltransferase family 2 protein [Hanamia caeni]|jgi:glycosyltransferase involved in cell wall biosynthesis|uniref:Glycosyltransferase family 2 protein n=1 Tax=Hanamia caeni TaxID=2294116 RepID=A0A3M9N300_9BACT|nr:glycosyltransferase family 2 protein [Hanamia caeni]RNI32180.1 glycosyltransferase family 2 protein [Hanamia caeni]